MIDKAEHTWDQGTDAADVVTYTCTECGKTRDLSLLSSVHAKAPHTYYCKDGSVLYTLSNSSLSDFNGLCQQYEIAGHAVYSDSDKNGNRFTTYTKGAAMAHISFYPSKKELNIAVSNTAGDTLPAKTPAMTDGDYPCTVAQLHQTKVNGMSYAVQLKDGSYIVYDGAQSGQAEKLATYLIQNYKGEGKPVIRAWVLTHSHKDHYPTFQTFSNLYASNFIVEHIIVSPLHDADYALSGETLYMSSTFYEDAAKFKGAKIVFAHTGMEFTFCNLKMEILLAPEDIYKSTTEIGNFNDTSIVSRLYDSTGYSALFLGDIAMQGAALMKNLYGDYLKSDICQVSHHGVEDVPFSFYDTVKAPILFYPCALTLYELPNRNNEVRIALEQATYTKEILIGGIDTFVREWETTFAANAPLHKPLE